MPKRSKRRFASRTTLAGLRAVLFASVVVVGGFACEKQDKETAKEPNSWATQEPAAAVPQKGKELSVPTEYSGPIDPMWPPTHPADLEAELAAARLIRQKLALGIEVNLLDDVVKGDHPDLFVTEGHIDGFDYLEVIFGSVPHPDVQLPLVVLLHGRGGRPHIPSGTTHVSPPIRIFIPRGPDPLGEGFQWLATYTLANEKELLVRSLAPRADQVAQIIAQFAQLRPTKGKPVVVGFSQGAILTYGIYARHPEILSAAIPIAGWLPPEMDPVSRNPKTYPPLIALHGERDTVVPPDLDRQTVERLAARRFPVALELVRGAGHVVTSGMNDTVRRLITSLLPPGQPNAPGKQREKAR